MGLLQIMQLVIGVLAAAFGIDQVQDYARKRKQLADPADATSGKKNGQSFGVGFVTTFFDALGIGCFAPTMACFKLFKMVRDTLIPATIAVGSTVACGIEAILFMQVIEVDPVTLFAMLICAGVGSFIGARVGSRIATRPIDWVMGIGLLVAGLLMIGSQFGLLPKGGTATGLYGGMLVLACAINFVLGFLLALGVGNYAPTMVLVYAMGMDPHVTFPIMIGCGFIAICFGGFSYIKEAHYDRNVSFWYAIGATPGALIAVFVVGSMPLTVLQWLVICVVFYTAVMMIRSAIKAGKEA